MQQPEFRSSLSPIVFFDKLPPKVCRSCGQQIQEQADCYTPDCHDCQNPTPHLKRA
ncbi:protein YhfH [Paenibacillus turpanensis]|uniref:protein YhfH n=1 Tax=Paenibacillus turpanensis TaxID=2689078 RepID=UPI00140C3A19|nr:protein YhfH [Paenibacillus turpanensis]